MDLLNKWIITFLVTILGINYQIFWLQYASVPYQTAELFNVDLAYVNILLVTLPFLLSFIFEFLFMFLTDYFGPKLVIIISSIGCFLAGVVRFLSFYPILKSFESQFWLLFLSTVFGIVFGCSTYVLPSKIAGIWFDNQSRILANNIMSQSQQAGLMLGVCLGPVFIPENYSVENFRLYSLIPLVLSIVAIILLVIYLWLSQWTGYPINQPPSVTSAEILQQISAQNESSTRVSKAQFIKIYVQQAKTALQDVRGYTLQGPAGYLTVAHIYRWPKFVEIWVDFWRRAI